MRTFPYCFYSYAHCFLVVVVLIPEGVCKCGTRDNILLLLESEDGLENIVYIFLCFQTLQKSCAVHSILCLPKFWCLFSLCSLWKPEPQLRSCYQVPCYLCVSVCQSGYFLLSLSSLILSSAVSNFPMNSFIASLCCVLPLPQFPFLKVSDSLKKLPSFLLFT